MLSRLVEKRQITRARKGPLNPNTNKQQWVYYLPEMEGQELEPSQDEHCDTVELIEGGCDALWAAKGEQPLLQTETILDTHPQGSLACPQGVSSVTEPSETASNPDGTSTVTPLTPHADTKPLEPSQDKYCDSLGDRDPNLPTQCYREGIRVLARDKTADGTKRKGITVPPPEGRNPSPHGVWILFDGDTDPQWIVRPKVWRCGG